MLGGVDRSGDVEAAAVEDLESGFGDVEPHALGEDVYRWIIWCSVLVYDSSAQQRRIAS